MEREDSPNNRKRIREEVDFGEESSQDLKKLKIDIASDWVNDKTLLALKNQKGNLEATFRWLYFMLDFQLYSYIEQGIKGDLLREPEDFEEDNPSSTWRILKNLLLTVIQKPLWADRLERRLREWIENYQSSTGVLEEMDVLARQRMYWNQDQHSLFREMGNWIILLETEGYDLSKRLKKLVNGIKKRLKAREV